jgi:hypothetical protein
VGVRPCSGELTTMIPRTSTPSKLRGRPTDRRHRRRAVLIVVRLLTGEIYAWSRATPSGASLGSLRLKAFLEPVGSPQGDGLPAAVDRNALPLSPTHSNCRPNGGCSLPRRSASGGESQCLCWCRRARHSCPAESRDRSGAGSIVRSGDGGVDRVTAVTAPIIESRLPSLSGSECLAVWGGAGTGGFDGTAIADGSSIQH